MNLSTIVKNTSHEKILQEYASTTAEYLNWIRANPGIRILDVISTFCVEQKSLDRLIGFLPILQPRSFPLCSSFRYHTAYMSIMIPESLSNDPTHQYLHRLRQDSSRGTFVYVALQKTLTLKRDPTPVPSLLIAQGITLAPFISLLFEAVAQEQPVRCAIFYCLGSNEKRSNFTLRRSLRTLQKLNVIEHQIGRAHV